MGRSDCIYALRSDATGRKPKLAETLFIGKQLPDGVLLPMIHNTCTSPSVCVEYRLLETLGMAHVEWEKDKIARPSIGVTLCRIQDGHSCTSVNNSHRNADGVLRNPVPHGLDQIGCMNPS
jgi:hypothetical protein